MQAVTWPLPIPHGELIVHEQAAMAFYVREARWKGLKIYRDLIYKIMNKGAVTTPLDFHVIQRCLNTILLEMEWKDGNLEKLSHL